MLLCVATVLILTTDAFVCKRSIRRAGPVAATTEPSSLAPVLSPSADRPERWDSACVANPVVLKPGPGEDRWKMWYYGNNGNWSDGTVGFLPTGTSGLAESPDGVRWTKIDGPRADKSVFGPADDVDAWDGLHTGVGDVIREDDGSLLMFYFGGGGKAANGYRGLGMQIGRARSVDGGRSWTRCGSGADGAGPVLEARAEEGLFASWPRILRYDDKWVMLYHAFNGTHWRAFSATSTDAGLSWADRRLALDVGPAGAFDETGVGTRSVIKRGDHALMVYEGVDGGGTFSGTHRLGAATSSDGGRTWARVGDGQAIVAPGIVPLGEWTSQVVGTPYLVADSGALRLYHCAKQNSETNMSIGLLISESGNVAAGAWRGVM